MFYLFSLISFAKLSKAQNNDLMINIPNKWAFRNDNENNAIVKAAYTGEAFKKDLWDFTICFRFRVLYFNPSHIHPRGKSRYGAQYDCERSG